MQLAARCCNLVVQQQALTAVGRMMNQDMWRKRGGGAIDWCVLPCAQCAHETDVMHKMIGHHQASLRMVKFLFNVVSLVWQIMAVRRAGAVPFLD